MMKLLYLFGKIRYNKNLILKAEDKEYTTHMVEDFRAISQSSVKTLTMKVNSLKQ